MSSAKTAEPKWHLGTRNLVLDGVKIPYENGHFGEDMPAHCKGWRNYAVWMRYDVEILQYAAKEHSDWLLLGHA